MNIILQARGVKKVFLKVTTQ